ncbi:hypothetical protein BD410DRAFT_783146 [Rickenella mellea]|uniref:Uncharacterized protein n=1 Tax=Rickenella mellea TaxID=50990 RepID=A0A4Y7QH72_9AGAM|nr:hypothetical protein BD410DRAFT_783146 [Rickenella mellea]
MMSSSRQAVVTICTLPNSADPVELKIHNSLARNLPSKLKVSPGLDLNFAPVLCTSRFTGEMVATFVGALKITSSTRPAIGEVRRDM